MLYYDRIDVSGGIDFNQMSAIDVMIYQWCLWTLDIAILILKVLIIAVLLA